MSNEELYQKYKIEGASSLSAKEIADLIGILLHRKDYGELIEVAEYAISLIDMGINEDFIEDEDEEEEEIFSQEQEESVEDEDAVNAEELDEEGIVTLREFLLRYIIEAALLSKNYDKVYDTIKLYLATTDIRKADLYNDVALTAMGLNENNVAITLLKEILNDHIHKTAAINSLALCYDAIGEKEKGLKLLQDHLDEDPYDNITWVNYGNIMARDGNMEEALKAFDISFAIDDTNLACLKNMARVYKVMGNCNKAIKILDDAEKLDPNDYEVLIIKAECNLIMNKPKKAIKLFQTVLKEFPDRPEILHSLSVAYILDKQTDKGYRAAVKAWELDPENHFYKSFVAKILGEDKGLAAQADKLNKELLKDTDDPNIHMIVAQYYLNMNNPNKALKISLNVRENNPDFHHLHLFLARCYTILGKFDEAEKEFQLETDEEAKQEFFNQLNNAEDI